MRPLRSLTQRRGVLGLVTAAVVLAAPSIASAAIIHVTNLNDSGPHSLRQAIASAPPGSTITVPAGTIKLTSGQLVVNKKLEIDGAGAAATTISGNDASRVFALVGAVGVKITRLGIVHGRVAVPGGSSAWVQYAGTAVAEGASFDVRLISENVGQVAPQYLLLQRGKTDSPGSSLLQFASFRLARLSH